MLSSAVYYICYNGMVDAARMGVSGGTYFDILAVCLTAQAVSSFSSYGWYIYLLVSIRIAFRKIEFIAQTISAQSPGSKPAPLLIDHPNTYCLATCCAIGVDT